MLPTQKPVSIYSYNEEPLSVFPTNNCYPAQDQSKIDENSVLQHLISGMNTFVVHLIISY